MTHRVCTSASRICVNVYILRSIFTNTTKYTNTIHRLNCNIDLFDTTCAGHQEG